MEDEIKRSTNPIGDNLTDLINQARSNGSEYMSMDMRAEAQWMIGAGGTSSDASFDCKFESNSASTKGTCLDDDAVTAAADEDSNDEAKGSAEDAKDALSQDECVEKTAKEEDEDR